MNDTNNLPEAVEVAPAELLHAQLLLGVATAKRRPTADAPEVLAASKALIAVCDAVRAALAQPAAAPVVERADSATPVVERSAGNVSDNAAPVAPARWYCVTNYGGATLCTGRDDAAEVAAEQDIAIPRHGPHRAVMLAEVRPARVPLTDAQIDQIKAQPGCWEHVGQRIEFRYRPFARAIEAHHGITAQGEPK